MEKKKKRKPIYKFVNTFLFENYLKIHFFSTGSYERLSTFLKLYKNLTYNNLTYNNLTKELNHYKENLSMWKKMFLFG